ncbi:MAG: hypothetical protein IJ735_01615 [Clostridia bacterium]|nr:hypothetical protein [Clostridia bacterium]
MNHNDEVDYSAFFYRTEPKDPNVSAPTERVFSKRAEVLPDRKDLQKRKKSGFVKKVFFTLTVVALLFAISLLAVDFFTNGSVLGHVFSALRGSDYEYVFVVTERSQRDYAYAQSLLVKQGGGSGYVLSEEDKYYVCYAVFSERSDAQRVADKNPNTFLKTLGFSTKDVSFANDFDRDVRTLIAVVADYESGKKSEAEAYAEVKKVSDGWEKKLDEQKDLPDAERDLLNYSVKALSGQIFAEGTRAQFLSDMRYSMCSIVSSFCRTMQ